MKPGRRATRRESPAAAGDVTRRRHQVRSRRRVAASSSGLGGALATIVVWIVGEFGVTVPAEVAAAFATLIGSVVLLIDPAGDSAPPAPPGGA